MKNFWRKNFFEFLTILAVSAATAATCFATPLPQAEFLSGVTLLHRGSKAKGYQKLEATFKTANDAKLKAQSALILAFAHNRELKNKKRYQYAEECLKLAKNTLNQKDKDALNRIAGDGYFEIGEFEKADAHFKELEKSPDPASVTYSIYKRGWIYLNQKNAPGAFELWFTHLFRQDKPVEKDLKLAILQDLGRSWAESGTPSEKQDADVRSLSLSSEETAKFVEGTALGARRFEKPADLEIFRQHLYSTVFALPVFQHMLNDGMGFKKESCHILHWAEPVDVTQVNSINLVPLLNMCAKSVIDTYGKSPTARETADRLLSVSKRIQIQGLARWGRAELFSVIGDLGQSCSEYLKMANEHLSSDLAETKPLPTAALESLYHSCQKYADLGSHSVNPATQTSVQLLDLLKIFSEKKLIAQDAKHPLYELTHLFQKVEGFNALLIEKTLDNPIAFQSTLLPTLAAEAALHEKQNPRSVQEKAHDLLLAFAPKPMTGKESQSVWFELLRLTVKTQVEKKNFDDAEQDLQLFIPLETKSAANLKLSELWLYWALSLPTDDTDHAPVGKKLVASLSNAAPAMSEDQRLSLMALAVKYEELAAIWKHWSSFASLGKNNGKVFSLFLDKSFEQVLLGKLALRSLPQETSLKTFTTAANAAFTQSLDFEAADTLTHTASLTGIEKTLFSADAKVISELLIAGKKLNAKPLQFTTRLAQDIQSALKALRDQIEQIRTRTWSHTAWSSLSKRTVAQNCDLLRARIENIRKPKWMEAQHEETLKQQLKPVIDTLLEWKDTLQGSIQAHLVEEGGSL